MAGYYGFSKSNNAIEAEEQGLLPASILAKKLGVSAVAIKHLMSPDEYHHTGLYYNRTDYYDGRLLLAVKNNTEAPLWADDEDVTYARRLLQVMRRYSKRKPTTKVYHNCHIEWTEWRGYGRHKQRIRHEYDNCTVTDKGSAMIEIKTPSGQVYRKKKNGRWLYVYNANGQRLY